MSSPILHDDGGEEAEADVDNDRDSAVVCARSMDASRSVTAGSDRMESSQIEWIETIAVSKVEP